MISGKTPRILVAPLDWGLGHATRLIPVTAELLERGCEIWFAGNKVQQTLFRQEFPDMPLLNLEGYNIAYSKNRKALAWKMLFQIPRILSSIKKEHRWLKQAVKTHRFDAVISDNRYGLYHPSIVSVFITHQICIQTPFFKSLIQKWNFRLISRFTECWIPDAENENNLAGELSHSLKKPNVPVSHIGPLSRFEKTGIAPVRDHLVVLLSGPEPQRTILETRIIDEISHYPGTAVVVRGLPSEQRIIPSTNMIKFYNHLPAKQLNEEIEKADFVIARSGYSTIMDMMKLKKKTILIPTPGQTEQEYLAGYLCNKRAVFATGQKNFSLFSALEKAKQFNYSFPEFKGDGLRKTICRLVNNLKDERN
jgi:uncharacterized protein (TIGR00661 family)